MNKNRQQERGCVNLSNSNTSFGAADISTRSKRRQAVSLIISELSLIRNAEEAYMERIPINLQGSDAYAAADESIELLDDAILTLMDAY